MNGVFNSSVDGAFIFVISISIAILIGVTVAMIYFVIRYHHTRHTDAKDIHGNVALEVTWTVIPTLLVLGMFWFGFKGYEKMRAIPDDAMQVETVGRMWSWQFTYENGIMTDTLYVPVGRPVALNLTSQDVIHSFYIPGMRVKKDVVPGVGNRMWFQAESSKEFDVFCAEYCGDQHAYMYTKVVALQPADFDAWYAEEGKNWEPAAKDEGKGERKPGSRGPMLARIKGCVACHSSDGSRLIGPSFKGVFGHEVTVIRDGEEMTITADEEYIRRSILQPDYEKVKGYENLVMTQIELTDEELDELVAYIKGLQ